MIYASRIIVLTAALLIAGGTFAGGLVGNGGSGVVCRDSSNVISSVETLDLYEARTLRRFSVDLGDGNLKVAEKLSIMTQRVSLFDLGRSKILSNWIATFEGESQEYEGVILADIPDTSHLVLPENCRLEQIVIQRSPQFAGDRRYTINKTLWDRLDSDNKTALIFHEVLYRQAIEQEASNSLGIRFLVGFFASKQVSNLTIPVYHDYLRSAGFTDAWIDTLRVSLTEARPNYFPNGKIKDGILLDGSRYMTPWGELPFRCHATFDELGRIKAGLVSDNRLIQIQHYGKAFIMSGSSDTPCGESGWKSYSFVFDNEFNLRSISLGRANPVYLERFGNKIFLYDYVVFHDDGSGQIAFSSTTHDDPGELVVQGSVCYPDGEISFFRSGHVENISNLSRCKAKIGENDLVFEGNTRFYDKQPGHVRFTQTPSEGSVLKHGSASITLKGSTTVSFSINGSLESGTLGTDFEQTDRLGRLRFYGQGMVVTFDKDGFITHAKYPLDR